MTRPLSPDALEALLAMKAATNRTDVIRLAMAAVLQGAPAAVAHEAVRIWARENEPQTIWSHA